MATDLRRRNGLLDTRSFALFYRRHLSEVYRFVLRDVGNRADAEEVTQTAFLDAFRALRRGHDPEQPSAWIYGIARNATRRRYRTQSRRPREVELGAEFEAPVVEDDAPLVEGIRAAVAELRPNYREILFLREIEGLSYTEIARRMDLSHAAVETLLFRARRVLRERLEAEGLRPAVHGEGRLQRLPGAAIFPVGLARLLHRGGDALQAGLAAKAAGAVAVLAIGTGVAAGTGALPVTAATGGQERAGQAVGAAEVDWPAGTLAARTTRDATAPRKARGHAKLGTRRHAGPSATVRGGGQSRPKDEPHLPAPPPSSAGTGGLEPPPSSSGSGSPLAALPAAEVPSVSVPRVTVPPVSVSTPVAPVVPVVSEPPVTTPAVSTPTVTVPPVEAPAAPAVPGL